jgi:hypothetical protein
MEGKEWNGRNERNIMEWKEGRKVGRKEGRKEGSY